MKNWSSVSKGQAGAAVGLLVFIAWMRAHSDGWVRILDDANLLFHEAGHPIYGILGQTMGLYGGTLGQLTFPTICSIHFWRRNEPVSFALCLAWFFENGLNIARYMADARAQILPLVGGGEHDWVNIFLRWNVLGADTKIAAFVTSISWIGYGGAALWLLYRANLGPSGPDSFTFRS